MSVYPELSLSIEEVMEQANESQEFKNRLSKLIENFFDNSYQEHDISELIDLVQQAEGEEK